MTEPLAIFDYTPGALDAALSALDQGEGDEAATRDLICKALAEAGTPK